VKKVLLIASLLCYYTQKPITETRENITKHKVNNKQVPLPHTGRPKLTLKRIFRVLPTV
jgi:hypothetical protein